MSMLKNKIHPAWILAAALGGAVLVHQSEARRAGVPAPPTTVVMVDLERVFSGLLEEADGTMQEMVENLEKRRVTKAEVVERLQEDIDLYAEGSEKQKTALNDLTIASIDYRSFVEFSRGKIDIAKSKMLQRVYGNIKKAVAELAGERGYNAVLRSDTRDEIPVGSSEDTMRQISLRRLLFTDDTADVTDELIAWMNR